MPAERRASASMSDVRRETGVSFSRSEDTLEGDVVAYEATKPARAVLSFASCSLSAVKISPAVDRSSA